MSTKRVDIFPAIIYLAPPDSLPHFGDLPFQGQRPQGTRKVDRCRVAIFNDQFYIVTDSPEGPQIIFRERIADYTTSHAAGRAVWHHAITTSGKIAVFSRDLNCGCGSRLRSWSPFGATAYSTADPTE